jgi:hypothetical protein
VVFFAFAITTVYSFFYDKANGKPDLYSLISCAAFAIMSLCLSELVHLGFEVELLYFFCGYLTLQLMKIKLFLVVVGIIFSYFLITLRFYLDKPIESAHLERLQIQDQPLVIQVDADSEQFSIAQVNSYQTNTAIESAESAPNMNSEDMDLGPVTHEHSLQRKPPGAPYKCSGCKEQGFGSSYHCENINCNYILHEECANPDSNSYTHPFFEKSNFEFHKKPPGYGRYCDACGKDVLGYVYHCSSTNIDLHPCCLNLKHSISDESGNVTLKLSHRVRPKCAKCKHKYVVGRVQGWSYYDGNSCCYHVSCLKDLILEKLEEARVIFLKEIGILQIELQ